MLYFRVINNSTSVMSRLVSVNFEVFGRVQGVFFRKFTMKTASKAGLVGWVRNTRQGTVEGVMQGPQNAIVMMRQWLQKTGSPLSRIEKVEFTNDRELTQLEFQKFSVRGTA